MSKKNRYLPLFDAKGDWIYRADLYLLVRMSAPETTETEVLTQIHALISTGSDNSKPELNEFEQQIEEDYIRGHLTARNYAAAVLGELYRLDLSNEPPTLGKALALVAHNLSHEKPNTQERSLKDQAKRAFSKWRSICHLQLALQFSIAADGHFENDPTKQLRFLAQAKAFEVFMDGLCENGAMSWNPWRIPEQIEPAFIEALPPISDSERKLLGLT